MKSVQPLSRGRLKNLLLKKCDRKSNSQTKEPKKRNEIDREINKEYAESSSEGKTAQENMLTSTEHLAHEQDYSSDSSASSVDDHLVDPEMLNLDEPFFSLTYQSQPMAAAFTASCMDENVFPDSEGTIADLTADEKEDKMHQIYSQIREFERQVVEASACCQSWERKPNGLQNPRAMPADAFDVRSLLTQAEGSVHQKLSNAYDPEWKGFEERHHMVEDTQNIDIFISNTSHKTGRIVDVARSLDRLEQEKRKKQYLEVHKVHLLLLIAYGIEVNRSINSSVVEHASEIYDLVANSNLSIPEKDSLSLVKSIVDYFRENVQLATKRNGRRTVKIKKEVKKQLIAREASCRKMFNVILITLLRFLGIRARLVIHLDVVPKRPPIIKAAPKVKIKQIINPSTKERYRDVPLTTTEILKRKPEIKEMFHLPQLDGADVCACNDDLPAKKVCIENPTNKPRLWKLKSKTGAEPSAQTRDRSMKQTNLPIAKHTKSDQHVVKLVSSKFFRKKPVAMQHRQIESNDRKNDSNEKPNFFRLIMHKPATIHNAGAKKKHRIPHLDTWIECFLEPEQRWTVIEAVLGDVECMERVIDLIQDPPVYALAWETDGTIIDVSQRYWWRNEPLALKQRVDKKWLKKALQRHRPPRVDVAHLLEQLEFRQLKFRAPIPASIAQFKNHPSYCLKRDLQKFQGIYPPNAPPLGFIQGEPIFARECVHTLHSREVWLRHAKVIRMHESPYKVVKSKLRREQTNLELFGHWQTKDYIPAEPIDGIVPRNAYGNIEIFKACMLPKGTVHLKQYGLSHICRKLGIDYAVAVVGFGIHAGGNHPVFDGIVICAEHQDRLLDAWEIHQEESTQKKKEKKQQLVMKNWVKLVKGLLVRRKLKNKYNFDGL